MNNLVVWQIFFFINKPREKFLNNFILNRKRELNLLERDNRIIVNYKLQRSRISLTNKSIEKFLENLISNKLNLLVCNNWIIKLVNNLAVRPCEFFLQTSQWRNFWKISFPTKREFSLLARDNWMIVDYKSQKQLSRSTMRIVVTDKPTKKKRDVINKFSSRKLRAVR